MISVLSRICIGFGFDNIVLNLFATVVTVSGLKITLFAHCVSLNIQRWLWPFIQVCCLIHYFIKVIELVWLSLIQSLFLTHHCYTYSSAYFS